MRALWPLLPQRDGRRQKILNKISGPEVIHFAVAFSRQTPITRNGERTLMSKNVKANQGPTHQEITARAHRIYEAEGRPEGKAMEHWLQAEAQFAANGRVQRKHRRRQPPRNRLLRQPSQPPPRQTPAHDRAGRRPHDRRQTGIKQDQRATSASRFAIDLFYWPRDGGVCTIDGINLWPLKMIMKRQETGVRWMCSTLPWSASAFS